MIVSPLCLAYGYLNQTISNSNLNYTEQSDYFTKYRIFDLLFYQTNYNQHNLTLIAKISSEAVGSFNIFINYSAAKANNFNNGNDIRKNFQTGIEYKIKAY